MIKFEDSCYRSRNQFWVALANCIDMALLVKLCLSYKSTYSLANKLLFQSSNHIFFCRPQRAIRWTSQCVSQLAHTSLISSVSDASNRGIPHDQVLILTTNLQRQLTRHAEQYLSFTCLFWALIPILFCSHSQKTQVALHKKVKQINWMFYMIVLISVTINLSSMSDHVLIILNQVVGYLVSFLTWRWFILSHISCQFDIWHTYENTLLHN